MPELVFLLYRGKPKRFRMPRPIVHWAIGLKRRLLPPTGKQTAKLSWAASTGSAISGYCIWRGRASGAENAYAYVHGRSSTLICRHR